MVPNPKFISNIDSIYNKFGTYVVQAVSNHGMYGLEEVVRLCLVALVTDGHVLLEGNPGLGKTALVKTLGDILDLKFGRIQFTPDLMPADITGTYWPDYEGGNERKFDFKPGPIFCNLLLADEINRATPKTQSAMLEAMAERQVTVLGKTRKMSDIMPIPIFIVLATQNPIDQQGTFDLPEAQADRFMFKILLQMPGNNILSQIMQKEAGVESPNGSSMSADLPQVDNPEKTYRVYREIAERYRELELPKQTMGKHILNMIQASNKRYEAVEDLRTKSRLEQICKLMLYGLGTRASYMLARGAKAYTLLFIRGAVNAADPEALVKVALPILRHRIKLDTGWKVNYEEEFVDKGFSSPILRDLPITWDRLVMDFFLLSAPAKIPGYREALDNVVVNVLQSGI